MCVLMIINKRIIKLRICSNVLLCLKAIYDDNDSFKMHYSNILQSYGFDNYL